MKLIVSCLRPHHRTKVRPLSDPCEEDALHGVQQKKKKKRGGIDGIGCLSGEASLCFLQRR